MAWNTAFIGELYGNKNIGGIAGIKTKDGQMLDCINYGLVSANENVGGVLGKLCYEGISESETFVAYCVNTGAVTGTGADTGGVVGYMQGNNDLDFYSTISKCGNYGKVTGSGTGVECAQWAQRVRWSVGNRKDQWNIAAMRVSWNAATGRLF